MCREAVGARLADLPALPAALREGSPRRHSPNPDAPPAALHNTPPAAAPPTTLAPKAAYRGGRAQELRSPGALILTGEDRVAAGTGSASLPQDYMKGSRSWKFK